MESIVAVVNAIIGALNLGTSQVESANSSGVQVRAQVRRGVSTLETTGGQANPGGSVQVTFSTSVLNGDVLAIHASNNAFVAFDEDFRTIPTPNFSFEVGTQNIKFDEANVLAPNSAGGDNITVVVVVTDGNGVTGTLTITGTKNAINALNDSVNIPVDGVNGSFTYVTGMGNVFLLAAYNVGYNATLNEVAEMSITDSVGWENAQNVFGLMNAITNETGDYLVNEVGEVVTFF